jgi:hypothetical protein
MGIKGKTEGRTVLSYDVQWDERYGRFVYVFERPGGEPFKAYLTVPAHEDLLKKQAAAQAHRIRSSQPFRLEIVSGPESVPPAATSPADTLRKSM